MDTLHYTTDVIEVKPFKITCRFNNGEVRKIDLEKKLRDYARTAPSLF